MNSPLRAVFWGSPKISAQFLEHLFKNANDKFCITACVTQSEKTIQRQGKSVARSAVHVFAEENGIPVFTPRSVKKEAESLLQDLRKVGFDLFIVLAYGKILPQSIICAPRLHSVNFHASLLPLLRGASPIEHSLLQGFTETGWTLQRITEELDAGDIVAQTKVSIDANETTGTLYAKLTQDILDNGIKMLEAYTSGETELRAQDAKSATVCGKIFAQDGHLNFSHSAEGIRNRFRAFTPRPGVFVYFQKKKIKLTFDLDTPPLPLAGKPSSLVREGRDNLFVVCGDGRALKILTATPDGKKEVMARDFINGYRVETGDEFV